MSEIPDRLRRRAYAYARVRAISGLSVHELGRRAGVGHGTVWRTCEGLTVPRDDTRDRIESALRAALEEAEDRLRQELERTLAGAEELELLRQELADLRQELGAEPTEPEADAPPAEERDPGARALDMLGAGEESEA